MAFIFTYKNLTRLNRITKTPLLSVMMPIPAGNSVRVKLVVRANLHNIKEVIFIATSLSGKVFIPFEFFFGW